MEGWAALLLALLGDALIGDPPALYRRVPHPVVAIGHAITALEHLLLDAAATSTGKRVAGIVLASVVVGGAALVGLVLQLALAFPGGWIVEGLVMSTLLAQRSLVEHVLAVAAALERGLEPARAAVARLVGRDPESLDAHGVARAALESLAENLSDGVMAPLFWAMLLGLPGMLAYKPSTRWTAWSATGTNAIATSAGPAPGSTTSSTSCRRGSPRCCWLRQAWDRAARRRLAPPAPRGATPAGTARPMPAGPRRRSPGRSASASPARGATPEPSSSTPGWATGAARRRPPTSAPRCGWRGRPGRSPRC